MDTDFRRYDAFFVGMTLCDCNRHSSESWNPRLFNTTWIPNQVGNDQSRLT